MTASIQEHRFVDRRGASRTQTNLKGAVSVDNGEPMPCIVKNISCMGALIVFQRPTILPENFKLTINEYFFAAECVVRHKSPDSVGIMFVSNRREALAHFGSPYHRPLREAHSTKSDNDV